MTREEKIAKAIELRAQDFTSEQIAERLGASPRAVRGWFKSRGISYPARDCRWCGKSFAPEHGNQRICSQECRDANENARKRNCEGRARGECVDCGATLTAGSAWRSPHRCRPCWEMRERERVDERARKVEAWWAAGRSMSEIAAELGVSMNHLRNEMHRLREKGYDLPYRYTEGKRAGRKFPEQVAA